MFFCVNFFSYISLIFFAVGCFFKFDEITDANINRFKKFN